MERFSRVSLPFTLAAVLTLALLLRLPHLNGSFWLDEAAQALESRRPLAQQLHIVDDFQPPLIHLLVHFAMYLGEAEWWLRTVAALVPGLVSIAALYLISQKHGFKTYSALPALLLTTSSFHIFYSQELRPYSLPTMFAVLGWLAVTHLTTTPILHTKKWLVIWALCNALGLYSSYVYPFAFIGQVVYLMTKRRAHKQIFMTLTAMLISMLTFLPWLPSFLAQLHAGQTLRADLPGWESIVSFTQVKALTLTVGKFLFGILDLSTEPIYLMTTGLVGAIAAYLFWYAWKNARKQLMEHFLLFSCWVALPILIAWVVSFWVPVVQPKRVLFALPGAYLFISWLIQASIKQSARPLVTRMAQALLAVLFMINLTGILSYYLLPKYQRENWREVHHYITQKYSSESSIAVLAFPAPFAGWEWYNRQNHFPTYATGSYVLSTDPTSSDRVRLKTLTDKDFLLIFEYLRDITDPQRLIEKDLARYGYTEVDRITPDTPLGIIKVYAKTGQILGYSEY